MLTLLRTSVCLSKGEHRLLVDGLQRSLVKCLETQVYRVSNALLFFRTFMFIIKFVRWLGGLLVECRTSVSQIRGSIPGQVAAV